MSETTPPHSAVTVALIVVMGTVVGSIALVGSATAQDDASIATDSAAEADASATSADDGGVLTGTVVNRSDVPIDDAKVNVTDSSGERVRTYEATNGEFSFDLNPGEYTVNVTGFGDDFTERTVTVTADDTTTRTFMVESQQVVNDRFEPNDISRDATPISEGSYAGLRIYDGESDRFAISLDEGDTLNASITFENETGDLDLYLADTRDQPLDRSSSATDNESVSAPTVSRTGTYELSVYPGRPGESAPYDLNVTVTPPGDVAPERQVEATGVQPGSDVSVTVEAVSDGGGVVINETFTPAVADASVESVTVDGQPASGASTDADSEGVRVSLARLDPGQSVEAEYTITIPEDASFGTNYTIAGTVERDSETPVPADEIAVTEDTSSVPQYDTDGDGEIDRAELAEAAADFANGDLSRSDLGIVAANYASNR